MVVHQNSHRSHDMAVFSCRLHPSRPRTQPSLSPGKLKGTSLSMEKNSYISTGKPGKCGKLYLLNFKIYVDMYTVYSVLTSILTISSLRSTSPDVTLLFIKLRYLTSLLGWVSAFFHDSHICFFNKTLSFFHLLSPFHLVFSSPSAFFSAALLCACGCPSCFQSNFWKQKPSLKRTEIAPWN